MLWRFPPLLQSILNNDETTHLLENLEPDTPYDVSVTAIYPDESESEDLLGTERTRKTHFPGVHSTGSATIQATFYLNCHFCNEALCTLSSMWFVWFQSQFLLK